MVRRHTPAMRPRRAGFAFLSVLAWAAISALATGAVAHVWSQQARREREQQLLRVGAIYAHAIDNYRSMSPGTVKHYPATLDDLLLDTRFVHAVRHLRRPYTDPVNPGKPWGLLHDANGRITGVHSLSQDEPVSKIAPVVDGVRLDSATRYSQWRFFREPQP